MPKLAPRVPAPISEDTSISYIFFINKIKLGKAVYQLPIPKSTTLVLRDYERLKVYCNKIKLIAVLSSDQIMPKISLFVLDLKKMPLISQGHCQLYN